MYTTPPAMISTLPLLGTYLHPMLTNYFTALFLYDTNCFVFCCRGHVDQKNNLGDNKNSQDSNNTEKKKPHIKKPLNAFMLYMKEMRAKVVAECTLKESAAINQILGRRVRPFYICIACVCECVVELEDNTKKILYFAPDCRYIQSNHYFLSLSKISTIFQIFLNKF